MDKININIQKNQKVWFTSDTHFGHKNILKFCQRPFENIKEHNKALIEYWNELVRPHDIVFHMGDVCWFNSRTETFNILKQLNGQIYIIPGNHDVVKQFERCTNELPNFHLMSDTVNAYLVNYDRTTPGRSVEVFLSHAPQLTWTHRDRKSINLFGHIHSGPVTQCDVDNDLEFWAYQYDCGCDNNNYRPIELHEILAKLNWPNVDPLSKRTF